MDPRHLKLALAMAAILLVLAGWSGSPFLLVFLTPGIAGALATLLVGLLFWFFGPWRRGYLYGQGYQERWGYLGHDVRGDRDDAGQLWISLSDCQHASGLPLERQVGRLCPQFKRQDDIKGWLVTREGMDKVMAALRGDVSEINRLRLFLEREVWRTRRG